MSIRPSVPSLVRFALLAAVVAVSLPGCKQGLGDVCQVDDDCEDGLVCNPRTETCVDETSGNFVDAGPDAAPAPDAAPQADAGAPDGAPPDGGALDGGALDGG